MSTSHLELHSNVEWLHPQEGEWIGTVRYRLDAFFGFTAEISLRVCQGHAAQLAMEVLLAGTVTTGFREANGKWRKRNLGFGGFTYYEPLHQASLEHMYQDWLRRRIEEEQ